VNLIGTTCEEEGEGAKTGRKERTIYGRYVNYGSRIDTLVLVSLEKRRFSQSSFAEIDEDVLSLVTARTASP